MGRSLQKLELVLQFLTEKRITDVFLQTFFLIHVAQCWKSQRSVCVYLFQSFMVQSFPDGAVLPCRRYEVLKNVFFSDGVQVQVFYHQRGPQLDSLLHSIPFLYWDSQRIPFGGAFHSHSFSHSFKKYRRKLIVENIFQFNKKSIYSRVAVSSFGELEIYEPTEFCFWNAF